MDILQMSFSAAVLIIAVVILRALALYKLPKKTFLVLWGVALCRLLLPFSIPTQLSFFTGADMLLKQIPAVMVPAVSEAVIPNVSPAPSVGAAAALPADGAVQTDFQPFILIWFSGICLCALFFAVSYIRCRREFKTALPVENDVITAWRQAHPLRRTVQFRQSDRLGAPLTYGVLRPVLLVPKTTDWTDKQKLRYILAHEYAHIRRFDALLKLLLTAVLCVHWFNPFVWVMYLLANRDIELSCDETVLKESCAGTKSDYAMALIGLEEKKSRPMPLCNSFSKNAIEERIKAVMKSKKLTIPAIIAAVVIVVTVTFVFATSKAKPGDDAGAQASASVAEQAERAAAEQVTKALEKSVRIAKENELLRQLLQAAETDVGTHPVTGAPADNTGDTVSPAAANEASPATPDNTASASKPSADTQPKSGEKWVWPCPDGTAVTSAYGHRFHPVRNEYIFSDHIEIGADAGAAVVAVLDGTVSEAGFNSEQGNYIVLDHGDGVLTVYRHLRELLVSTGDAVAAGDTIGAVGATGAATGPFLAFCVYVNGSPVDPLNYFEAFS